jgi:hypothetical protein
VGKPEGKRPLGRPRHRWVDNIRMDLGEVGWDGMEWIDMAQYKGHWRDHWVSGICTSSEILNTRKHNVSETGFVSFLSFSFRNVMISAIIFLYACNRN